MILVLQVMFLPDPEGADRQADRHTISYTVS